MATVQIRNLSDEAYAVLKRRAKESGRSLQEYLRRELEEQASRSSAADLLARTRIDMAWRPDESSITMEDVVEAIHEGRKA